MSNPYTPVTVSNYNLNPPSDDGSETPTNEIKWSNHTSKLGNPLKTAIESVNTNTLAAVAKLAGGVTLVSDDYTILASDQGKTVVIDVAGKTITTADATVVGAQFKCRVLNLSDGDITLEGSGSQEVDGETSIQIPKTRGLDLDTDGADWYSSGRGWNPEIRPAPFSTPRGRLTLVTATPVLTSNQTGKTTVYFTPYQGNTIMLPDANGDWSITEFSEVSQALSDNTKSPAAATTSSLYDIFGWLDGTTFRATRGPAWTSGTARGSGAGTTELEYLDGVLVNANAISNGPGENLGVYLGTIATDGSTQLSMNMVPSSASGGSNNRLDVFNYYNRIPFSAISRDSDDSWNYTTATLRAANGSNSNRITFVVGVDEDVLSSRYQAVPNPSIKDTLVMCGVGLDSTSALATACSPGIATVGDTGHHNTITAIWSGHSGIGQHYVQALEYSQAVGITGWIGDNGGSIMQMALVLDARM